MKLRFKFTWKKQFFTCLVCLCLLALDLPRPAQAATVLLRLEPSELLVGEGQVETTSVWVEDVQNLYGVELHLKFDPAVVEVVDANPAQDGVQAASGSFLQADFVALNQADNEAGTIDYAMTQLAPTPAASGSGSILVISLRGKTLGASCSLTLVRGGLAIVTGTQQIGSQPYEWSEGSVRVVDAAAPTSTNTPTETSTPTNTPTFTPTTGASTSFTPTFTPTITPSFTPTLPSRATVFPSATPTPTRTSRPKSTSVPEESQPSTAYALETTPTSSAGTPTLTPVPNNPTINPTDAVIPMTGYTDTPPAQFSAENQTTPVIKTPRVKNNPSKAQNKSSQNGTAEILLISALAGTVFLGIFILLAGVGIFLVVSILRNRHKKNKQRIT